MLLVGGSQFVSAARADPPSGSDSKQGLSPETKSADKPAAKDTAKGPESKKETACDPVVDSDGPKLRMRTRRDLWEQAYLKTLGGVKPPPSASLFKAQLPANPKRRSPWLACTTSMARRSPLLAQRARRMDFQYQQTLRAHARELSYAKARAFYGSERQAVIDGNEHNEKGWWQAHGNRFYRRAGELWRLLSFTAEDPRRSGIFVAGDSAKSTIRLASADLDSGSLADSFRANLNGLYLLPRKKMPALEQRGGLLCEVIDISQRDRRWSRPERQRASADSVARDTHILCRVRDRCKTRQVLLVVPEKNPDGSTPPTWASKLRTRLPDIARGAKLLIRNETRLSRLNGLTSWTTNDMVFGQKATANLWIASFVRPCDLQAAGCAPASEAIVAASQDQPWCPTDGAFAAAEPIEAASNAGGDDDDDDDDFGDDDDDFGDDDDDKPKTAANSKASGEASQGAPKARASATTSATTSPTTPASDSNTEAKDEDKCAGRGSDAKDMKTANPRDVWERAYLNLERPMSLAAPSWNPPSPKRYTARRVPMCLTTLGLDAHPAFVERVNQENAKRTREARLRSDEAARDTTFIQQVAAARQAHQKRFTAWAFQLREQRPTMLAIDRTFFPRNTHNYISHGIWSRNFDAGYGATKPVAVGGVARLRRRRGSQGKWASRFRSEVAKHDTHRTLACTVTDIGFFRRRANDMERFASAYAGSPREVVGEYRILCKVIDDCKERHVLVLVPQYASWMKLNQLREGSQGTPARVTGYHFERDGFFPADRRGNILRIGRNSKMTFTGLALLQRYPSSKQAPLEGINQSSHPAGPLWVASFDTRCLHEGLPCRNDAGYQQPSITVEGATCDIDRVGEDSSSGDDDDDFGDGDDDDDDFD
jgi:hypothetical protein